MGEQAILSPQRSSETVRAQADLFCSVHTNVSEAPSGILNWKHTNKHASIKKIISDISPHPWLLNQRMMRGLPNTVNGAGCGL